VTDWENRPRDAEGRPCDYFQELPDGTREPRWRRPVQKRPTNKLDLDRWYRLSEVQKYLPVKRSTLTRACQSGILKASRLTPNKEGKGAPWLVKGRDLADFLDRRGETFALPGLPRVVGGGGG